MELLWPLRAEFLAYECELLKQPVTREMLFRQCAELAGHLLNQEDYVYLIAIDKDEAVGYMSFWRKHFVGRPTEATIALTGLYISPNRRGRTVLFSLIRAAQKFLKQGEITRIQFTVLSSNESMMKLMEERYKPIATVYEIPHGWRTVRREVSEESRRSGS
jgi:ribosomal protein S18 acetylase RimI-like enzyme